MKASLLLGLLLAISAVGAEPIRVACVGDSITAGVGASKGNSYPDQLGRMLGAEYSVKNFGVSGSTLLNHGNRPYQKTGSFKKALEFEPNVVVIKLGTNDTKSQNWKFKDEFIADYKDMVRQFAKIPSKPRIFICRPASFIHGANIVDINEEVEAISMLDKIAADEKVGLIDIHAALKDHPELFPVRDRVHPNTAGATAMAKTVFQALTGKEFTGEAPLVAAPAETKTKK